MEAYKKTRGRRFIENYSLKLANPFLDDLSRIYRCPSYRRLVSKTQVMTSPEDYYVRTRLSHTQEVTALAVHISESLGLNTTLCLAIAAGHDIGHAPYGHLGEEVMSELMKKTFRHNVASVVVAQHLENRGKGLNLSFETLQGILYHSRTKSKEIKSSSGVPDEYNAVMFADKIAYTSSDINDSIRYGYIKEGKLPDYIKRLGKTQDERDFNIISALIEESKKKGNIELSEGRVAEDFNYTRNFMFEEVYHKIDNQINRAILEKLYEFFLNEPYFIKKKIDPFVSLLLLTDQECNRIGKMMMGSRRFTLKHLMDYSVFRYLINFSGKKIDLTDPDLSWAEKREEVEL